MPATVPINYGGNACFWSWGVDFVGLGMEGSKCTFTEAHTDFIFPVIGEELGLVANLSILIFFTHVFDRWCQIARFPNK